MEIKTAEKILQYFDFKTMEVVEAYIEERRKTILMLLTREKNHDILRQQQGMLEELHTLSKIREYAQLITEGSRNG